MAETLTGLTILVPETRELDLFARLLEAEGARLWRCPLVQILDLENTADASAWIARCIAGAFQDVIWLTGEGLRRLLPIAEQQGQRAEFVDALGRVRNITRGPKPVRALRELGLAPGLSASTPTSQGVLDALAGEALAGRSIGLQLYPGDGGLPLLTQLRDRGAIVTPITPYRYASQAEDAQVMGAIQALIDGGIGMVAFTASPQVDRLLAVAEKAGVPLQAALRRVPIAAIGPVVAETLHRHGLAAAIAPGERYHLKPLVQAIAGAWRG